MEGRFRLAVILAIILALAIGVIAAQSQSHSIAAPVPTPTPTPIPTPLPDHVNIVVNARGNPPALFAPTTLVVRVGQTVTWVNMAGEAHSVASDMPGFKDGVLGIGQTYSWTPHKVGTYYYSCIFHPDMHGTIIVQP